MNSKRLSLKIAKGLRIYFIACIIIGVIASLILDIGGVTVGLFIVVGITIIFATTKWINALEVKLSDDKERV